MPKGIDSGKSFWQGVLSKISDPEQKAAAERLLANTEVMTLVGNGVEGQAEIDRRLQELTAKTSELTTKQQELEEKDAGLTKWHEDLTTWRTTNNELLELGKKAKTGTTPTPNPNPTPPVAGAVTEEKLGEKLGEALRTQAGEFLGFERDRQRLTRDHFAKFGEILDIEPLLQHAQIRDLGMAGVYDLVHKEALAKHSADATKKAEDLIRADERAKVLATTQSMPYPTPTGSNAGSPLDALKPIEGGGPLVDQAVTEYNRLVAARV